MSASLCHMQPPFRPHPMQQGPRSNVHQSDAGPPFVEPAALKVPPSRCVERNHVYTLRSWISDLIYFVGRCFRFRSNRSGSSGGIAGARRSKRIDKGVDAPPAAAWRCGSSRWTAIDWSHAVGVSSCAPICSPGSRNTTKSIAEFLSFRRQPGDGVDTVLVRFDILRSRAQARAGFAVNWTGLSWLLLQSLGLNAGCGTVCLLLLVVKCPRMNLIWRIDGTHQKVVSFEGGSDGLQRCPRGNG